MASSYTVVAYIFLFLTQNICHATWSKNKPSDPLTYLTNSLHELSENEYLMFGAKTAMVAGAVVVGAPLAISAAGFGAAGIVGGSAAAGFQGAVLGGSTSGLIGGAFATLQSIGAAGLGFGAKTAIVSTSAAVVKAFDVMGSNKEEDGTEKK